MESLSDARTPLADFFRIRLSLFRIPDCREISFPENGRLVQIVFEFEEVLRGVFQKKREVFDAGSLKPPPRPLMEADNGEIAIEAMNTGENRLTVDAMICDIRMPKINGLETIDYLRRAYPHVPVVVLTGFPDTQMAVECMRARRGGLPGETGGQQGVESGGRESDGTAGTGLAVSRLMRQRRTFHYSSVAAA